MNSTALTFRGGAGAFLPWVCVWADGGAGGQVCADIKP